jgi:hypothetical protein
MKKKIIRFSPDALFLSHEIFKTKTTQIVINVLLLFALGIQIYLFVTINQIFQTLMRAVNF